MKIEIILELFRYLWMNKMWWLIPLIVVVLIFGILLIVPGASTLIPFIYPLF